MESHFLNQAIVIFQLFFAGLLAGEEFVIRFGVRGPVSSLHSAAHIELRQGLIRRLRILVPILFACTLISSGVEFWIKLGDRGWASSPIFLGLGILALIAFIAVTLTGTVPINKAALDWDPVVPPPGWREAIEKWEMLDSVRAVLAVAAFVLFLLAALF